MPRRGGGGGVKFRGDWKPAQFDRRGSYSDEHDDRDRKPTTQRRVSFKPSGFIHRGGINGRMSELAIKTHLEDDDVMGEYMGGGSGGSHSDGKLNRNDKGRRKGSPIPRGKFGIGFGIKPSTFGWYQVTIPYGQKYNKDEIIRYLLNAVSPIIFIPHYWKQEKTCISFYVDNLKIAERLLSISRTIQMPDGFNLNVKVRSGTPMVTVDENFKERMKLVMSKRYNAQTKALDLSKFHSDPDFKDMFCGLFRPHVMSIAIEIIAKNIPDLEAINLNNNQLQHMESFKSVSEKIPNLKILYLSDNRISAVASLSVFRQVPIIELILTNNPLKYRYKDREQYISEVRRKFPKLIKLDGQDLEPLIGFDVHDTTTLPKPVATYFCNQNGVDIVREFLKQYFLIYDSASRQPLLEAYHEQALISLTCTNANQGGRLSNYWLHNRNLLRQQENDSKFRLIKCGRLPVVSFLSELPKTQHDLMSFSVDLSMFLPNLISFTVAGVFKELNNESSSSSSSSASEIRSFQRLVVIVPGPNGGFSIRNEMITISNATHVQVTNAFKQTIESTQTVQQRIQTNLPQQPMPSTSQVPSTVVSNAVTLPDDNTKLQMIQAMSTQSHMNLEWSKKCLEETNWDFAHAAYVFDKLNKESKIPPEAFVK